MCEQSQNRVYDLLAKLDESVKTRYSPKITKELVFEMARDLRNDGFALDVALAKAMDAHGIGF